jgi:hypothetical protein
MHSEKLTIRSEKSKIRSVEMENPLGKTEKSARYKWKIRSVKMENPLNKLEKSDL